MDIDVKDFIFVEMDEVKGEEETIYTKVLTISI